MFDSILDSVKGEIAEGLTSKLGLNAGDVDKTLSSTKEAFDKTVSDESKSNGVESIMNLFSKDDNSSGADGLLKGLGGNLISSLSSNGFSSDKASSITDMVIPIVVKFATDKIGGDAGMITGLLGGSEGVAGKASGLLKGFFK